MPDVVGRIVDLSHGRAVIEPFPQPRKPNGDRIAKLIVAARQYRAVKASSRGEDLVTLAASEVLAAALDID